nr:GNAT family N-acetyltransferase [Streptomyces physcomitrii]
MSLRPTARPADPAAPVPGQPQAPAPPAAPPVAVTSLTVLTEAEGTAPGAARRLAWLASDPDSVPLGSAFLRLLCARGQEHLAEIEVTVHPAHRRQGVGRRLLTAALDSAREQERRSVLAQVPCDSAAAAFLARSGFGPALRLGFTRLARRGLDLATVRALTEVPHPGYRLVHWAGHVPEHLLAAFVASRRAMDDMPMEDADHGPMVWDAARVAAATGAVARRGDRLHTVAVADEADGSLVGFTELVVPGTGTGDAQHYGTGVLPEHRGRGLALWLKAESVRLACEQYPDLDGFLTDTALSNLPMRAVNDRLGYRPTHQEVLYQYDLGRGAREDPLP